MKPNIIKFERRLQHVMDIHPEVPSIQRDIVEEAVVKIYETECSNYSKLDKYIIPGCISVAHYVHDHIIDGQHRLEAYRRLDRDFPHRQLLVAVDYYTLGDAQSIELLFLQVNTCTPNSVVSLGLNKYIIWRYIEKWLKEYKGYIKPTLGCRIPSLCIEKIHTQIIERNFMDKTGWTANETVEQMANLNAYYAKLTTEELKDLGIEQTQIDKIRVKRKGEAPLYFGLWANGEWIDRLIDIANGLPVDKITHYVKARRVMIVAQLRNAVWAKHGYGHAMYQPCFCCGTSIRGSNNGFHCGHIVAVSKGGTTTLDNLEPICMQCNTDMRQMNLHEYKETRKLQCKDIPTNITGKPAGNKNKKKPRA